MSAEGVKDLGKGSCKRQGENDDVIEGKRTRLRCKNAKDQLRTQTADVDISQSHIKTNATLSAEAKKKVDSSASESSPAKITYKDQPVLLKTIKPPTERERSYFSGIGIIGDEVFITCSNCCTLFVHSAPNWDLSRRLRIRRLMSAIDLVSCPRNKCLYIMNDDRPREILRVDTKGKIIFKWSTGLSWGTLSMTRESNLLLTDRIEGKLKEFSSEGELVLEVVLPEDISKYNLAHAFKLANGNFVLCHGLGADPLHRVCLVDCKGVVLKTIGEDHNTLKFNYPYLAVDSDESIFVSDDSRVLLLDSNLEFKRELLTAQDGLRYPWISLDELNRRLFVVDEAGYEYVSQDDRLLVFDIK